MARSASDALAATGELEVRSAGRADLDALTALLTAAFERDPLWRWVFPEVSGLEAWWRFCIGSALRYPSVWIIGDFAAASVWIPPGGVELTEKDEERVEPMLRELVGPRTDEVLQLLDRFESCHPRETPHYYLSLLGTDPSQRGKGLGMALLRRNLEQIDAEQVPAYLESSNPANDRRYERVGFRPAGEFSTPGDEHSVTTMWRDARPALSRSS